MSERFIQARRGDPGDRPDLFDMTRRDSRTGRGGRRIRCPKCGWEPARDSLWGCVCLHVWNTFDTGGKCPACGKQWEVTQCLRCHRYSRHLDWYVDEDEG